MGTRGLYGFRKDGVDKLAYNHYDSYPEYLGTHIVHFCAYHTPLALNYVYDQIELVDIHSKPSEFQIKRCQDMEWVDTMVGNKGVNDWYCLTRELQGNFEELSKCLYYQEDYEKLYMMDDSDFIKDSMACEYAYIINLDNLCLEYYLGRQREPQKGNRYGEEPDDYGYYPCRLVDSYPIRLINSDDDIDYVIKRMMELDNIGN